MLGLFVFILPARFVFVFFLSAFFSLVHIGGSVGGLLVRERERERELEKNREESDRSKRLEGLGERRKSKTGQRK